MCDTFSVSSSWSGSHSFFAKNSDREPGESQILTVSDLNREEIENIAQRSSKRDYLDISLPNLKKVLQSDLVNSEISYKALLSRPVWMWGAEIGVNQWGLAIGNEAVFSKGKMAETAILGMDLLRLTLHQCRNAKEAVLFISALVERFGQGGNGSYNHSLYYDNSFIVQDRENSWVIETSGKQWCAKEIEGYSSISNTYILGSDFSHSNEGLDKRGIKKTEEKKVMNFLAGGEQRNRYKINFLEMNRNNLNLEKVKTLLRSHNSRNNRKRKGMKSICIHNLPPFNSESTASMIIQYRKEDFVIWYTGNSFPCLSLYKPLIFDEELFGKLKLTDIEKSLSIHKKRQSVVRKLDRRYKTSVKNFMPIRDQLEAEFSKRIEEAEGQTSILKEVILRCHAKEREYLQSMI